MPRAQLSSMFFRGAPRCEQSFWVPTADVYRHAGGWLVKFDLAGVSLEDIEVAFDGSRLSVSGIRRDFLLEEDYASYSIEISYSRFSRTITLPSNIKSASLDIEYIDGMLLVGATERKEET